MSLPDTVGGEQAIGKKVVSAMKWQAAAQGIGQAVTWLSTLVVIRLLSPADYGLLAMAGVLTGFFLLVADMGVGAASVQARTLSSDDLQRLGGLAMLTNGVGFLLCIPAAPLLAAYFGEHRLTEIVLAQSVVFLILALYSIPQAQLMRALDFKRKSRVDAVAMVVSAVGAVGFALAGFGVWAIVIANLLLHSTRAVGYRSAQSAILPPTLDRGITRFLRFGALITLDRVLFFLISQADVVIGGRILGSSVLGVYIVAMSVAVIPLDKVVPILTQVSFAAYSRIQVDAARVRRSMLLAVRLVSFAAFPVFFGLAAVAGALVPAVLGHKWLEIVLPLQLISLILPLKAIVSMLPPALFGTGKPEVNVANQTLSLGLLVIALLVGVRHGIVGLSLAWMVVYPVIFAISCVRTARALGMMPRDLFLECWFPAVAAAAMGAVTFLLGGNLPADWSPWYVLIIQVVAGAVLYVAAVAAFRMPLAREALSLLRP